MITLGEIKQRVRERSDMENSNFIEDQELTFYVSSSYKELYDILVARFEDYYVEGPVSFTLAQGSSSYPLPADFYKMLGLDFDLGGNWIRVRPFSFADRNIKSDSYLRARGYYPVVQYRIVGSNLRFTPEDQANGTYRIWYVPRAASLTDNSQTIDGVNGWEEYIIVDAAIKCLTKEESDVTVLMMQKQSLLSRIEEMAQNRDVGESQRITDIGESVFHTRLIY